jgi:hypothetical protein
MKKLKLKATEMQALANVMVEAQLAYNYQDELQVPVKIDEKIGAVHELLTLADARTFDKDSVEALIAYLKEVPPTELAEVRVLRDPMLSDQCDTVSQHHSVLTTTRI